MNTINIMRKLTHLLLTTLLLLTNSAYAQYVSPAQIIQDTDRKKYVWAIGYGETLEEADSDAMTTLVSFDTNITSIETSALKDVSTTEGNYSESVYSGKSTSISNMYLENVRREVLADKDGLKRVLRYTSREDWDARNEVLRNKIEEYITLGKFAKDVEYKIQYFSWANVLLQTYPGNEKPIMIDDSTYAKHWLVNELRQMLKEIEISVNSIEHDKTNTHYPYKVYLDFIYQDKPIGDLIFSFFDGRGYVYNETVNDGRALVQVKDISSKLSIDIDCLNKNLARQLDPTIFVLLENDMYTVALDEAHKSIDLQNGGPKPQRKVNTASVDSKLNQQVKSIAETYVEIVDKVDSPKPFNKIMESITSSIQKKDPSTIREHFSDGAWQQYQRIVATGNPVIARTPEYKFIKHDTLTICQSIPLKLKFSGNRSFIEDVVFRIDNKSMKIESVAYRLSLKTEQEIMAMSWDDAARLTLINFLEDYRTAYCLMNIDYIDNVFADDAYIIVGRVLKRSNRKFSDSANYKFDSQEEVEYSHQTKDEYIYNLRKSFKSKEFVNIRFEDCNVAKGSDAKEGIYAVQVKQMYYSNNYADEGILTLAIDMREDIHPLVRVRVWQAERDVKYNAEAMIEQTISVEGSIN